MRNDHYIFPILSSFLVFFCQDLCATSSIGDASFFSNEVSLSYDKNNQIEAKRVSSYDFGNGNFAWNGKLLGNENGFLTFSNIDNIIRGTLFVPGVHTFRISKDGASRIETIEIESSNTLGCGECISPSSLPNFDPRPGRRSKTWRSGDGNVIDLMVAYTSQAKLKQNLSSESEVEAVVQAALAESNLVFSNSHVNASLRLVHLVEVNYQETNLPGTDLNRTVDQTDGYLDQLHSLRDQYGADLVSLLISEGDGTIAGIAKGMDYPSLDFEANGFNVVVIDQIGAPSYSLLHEIGHNMGCRHNREDAMNRGIPDTDSSNQSVFKAFNYGKRWLSGNEGYRTIMAYDTEDSVTYANRVPFFSNPAINYQGVPLGNENSEDNARVLASTIPYVSNFRDSVVQAFVPSVTSLSISEGNASSMSIRLASRPTTTHIVSLSLDSVTDGNFSLSKSTFQFTNENWNLPQPVQIFASKDLNSNHGSSVLYIASTGLPTSSVQITEIDSGTSLPRNKSFTGIVSDSLGTGIAGVSLSFSNLEESVITDYNGSFYMSIDPNWSGTVSLQKTGHTFIPNSLSISSDSELILHQSFVASRSNILFVNSSASGSGDGSNWANACTDLSSALRSEFPFSEVWVAEGTYKPGIFRSDYFLLPASVSVYGGFSGSETFREQRDPTNRVTILSGDIGISGESADNTFHVVMPENGSLLDGFTIQDGNASENYSDERGKGGGIYAKNVSFTAKNCIFQNNRARQKGGAIYLLDANVTLSNCSLTSNSGSGHSDGFGFAGGIYAKNAVLVLEVCNFSLNQSDLEGGGIFGESSEITSTFCNFSNNRNATSNGGGAIALKNSVLNDNNGTYSNNYTASYGGALDLNESNVTLLGTQFLTNQSLYSGGAIEAMGSNITAVDGNFSSNQVTSNNGGGGINIENGTLNLTRCKFSQNQSPLSGGAIYAQYTELNTTQCIFSSNQNTSNNGGGAIALKYSVHIDNNGTYSNNYTASNGGALDLQESNVTLLGTLLLNNQSLYSGGAIEALDSNITAVDGNFSSNQVTSNNGGGGINIEKGTLNLTRCEFSQNQSPLGGGAIYAQFAELNTTQCIFSSNQNTSSNGGGAIALQGGSLTDQNSSFSKNYTASTGGAIEARSSIISTSNSSFTSNESVYSGGALAFKNSSPLVSKCIFTTNTSSSNSGGAIYMDSNSSPTISSCSFYTNYTIGQYGYGGALYFYQNSGVQISDSLFHGNYATTGGAFCSWGATDLTFLGCKFIANEANASSSSEGGVALLSSNADQTKFVNCLISGNKANDRNGVIKPDGSTRFVNCTLVGNQSGAEGGITILFEGDSVAFENSILWRNSGGSSGDDIYVNSQSASASYSLFDPSKSTEILNGANNLSYDPLFIDLNGSDGILGTIDDDYNLQSSSPAIDQANSSAANYSSTDILGKTRYGSAPDLGAYEYRINSAPSISVGTSHSLSSNEDEGLNFTFIANDADMDVLTWSIVSQGSNGVASINSQTGALLYNPSSNWSGSDTLVLSVNDGSISTSTTVTISVSPTDDPPLLNTSLSDQTMNEDDSNLSIDLSNVFIDNDQGSTFTYSVSSSNSSLVSPVVVDGNLTLSLIPNKFGTSVISVSASSDGQSISDNFILSVSPVNDVPVLSNISGNEKILVLENSSFVFDLNATDEEEDSISFSISGTDSVFFECNASSGMVFFKKLPDFENPQDSGADNYYDIEVFVSDLNSSSSKLNLSIYIVDQEEDLWSSAQNYENGWRNYSWFGTYFELESGWVYHLEHGWLFRTGSSTQSTWFYDSTLQWIWTNQSSYPFFFRSDISNWMLYELTDGSIRNFYNYNSSTWSVIPKN